MAQVRIDESLLNDPRFKDLVDHIVSAEFKGDLISRDEAEEIALGKCWRAFILAQRYWRDGRSLIPAEEWKRRSCASFASLLLRFGLAVEEKGGIYVRGAREYFDWYHDKSEAGKLGGKKSGESRKAKSEQEYRSKRSRQAKQPKQKKEASESEEGSNEAVMLCSDSDSDSVSNTSAPLWSDDDPLAKHFSNLTAIPKYRAVFDPKTDRQTVEAHMKRNGLSPAEMEQVTWELRCWADGPNAKDIKSPRGTLATFVRNFVEKRAKNPPPATKKQTPIVYSVEDVDALAGG